MRERLAKARVKRARKPRGTEGGQRTRSVVDIRRMFDDLYSQLDLQLTRMGQIQLQFDALRSKIRLL